jgi:hypothetical protein
LDEKGLDVIVHDLVKRTLRGMPRVVARRVRGHSKPEGGRGASEEPDRVGLNSSVRERQAAVSARPHTSKEVADLPSRISGLKSSTMGSAIGGRCVDRRQQQEKGGELSLAAPEMPDGSSG